MNKKALVNEVYDRLENFSKRDTKGAVEAVISAIADSLSEGEDVKLAKFGKFGVQHREARVARNPRTGEAVDVPAKNVAKFKPSKVLNEGVQ